MRGISGLAAELLASPEGFCSMESVTISDQFNETCLLAYNLLSVRTQTILCGFDSNANRVKAHVRGTEDPLTAKAADHWEIWASPRTYQTTRTHSPQDGSRNIHSQHSRQQVATLPSNSTIGGL